MTRPNFFIVGAPRCGTTAMYRYLQAHPDIFMPQKKEPHFFGRDLDHLPIDVTDESAYLALFSEVKNEHRVGEASVWYLFSKTAAEEIKAFAPDGRIIIMLRNPVEMVYSLYQHLMLAGGETLPSLEEALAAEADRRAGHRIPLSVRRRHDLYYSEVVRFAEQTQRYFCVFGREAVHVIIFDDFSADTAAVYRATLSFLEVDPAVSVEFTPINESKRIRSRTLHFGYSILWTMAMRWLPPAAWKLFQRYVMRVLWGLNTYHAPRPPLDRTLRAQLQKQFQPEVERLSVLLDRDLMHWCVDREFDGENTARRTP